MNVCGLDPGTVNLGWSVLSSEPRLLAYGVYRPVAKSSQEARLAMVRHCRALLRTYRCQVVVLEDYTVESADVQRLACHREAITHAANAWDMLRLQGALEQLAWASPSPTIVTVAPKTWMRTLTGIRRGAMTKEDIAWVVQQRLGTISEPRGLRSGNHATDSAGCALWWLDQEHLRTQMERVRT